MKKNLTILFLIFLGAAPGTFAQTLIYNENFVSGVAPTAAECTAWVNFRASLLSTYTYTGFKISGSMYPTGISCTVPAIALAVANALRTSTAYSVFDGTDGQTWTVGIACSAGVGCAGTVVELANQGSCSCATGYSVRPSIDNPNWGGINGITCGASTQTLIVTFYAGPTPPTVTGDTSYCEGSTISLTASSTLTSPTFTWYGPSGFTATTASISVPATLSSAGIYSVSVTSGGSTSGFTLDTITIIPLPTITLGANPSICQGTTTAYLPYTATTGSPTNCNINYDPTALAAGFTNVTGAVLPVSPISLTVPSGAAAATYTGSLTVIAGGCSSAATYPYTITVNPSPGPITGVTNICTGTTTTLSDTSAGGTWSSITTSVATIGSSTGIVDGIIVGTSNIRYTLPTGCFTSVPVVVTGITGASDLCTGSSTTLSCTSTAGTWSSSDGLIASIGSTGIVTGVSMGTVIISYSLPIGCTAYKTMTINPIAPIAGRDSVCLGAVGYLTDIVGGGTWASQYTGVATILIDSGLVYGVAPGISNMTYTLPTGCVAYVNMTVIAFPSAITGTTQMCPGGNVSLSDVPAGGTWSSNNNYVATVNSLTGVVTGVFADTTTIFYTIAPNCAVGQQILVNPDPAPITGTHVICPGVQDTMHDITPAGAWSSTTPSLASINSNGVVTTIAGGIATIKYTLPLTGCFTTTTLSIFPSPAPVITYVQADGTFYCDTPWVTYQWYDSIQGKIIGATSPTLAALNSEYYYVVVTDTNGCSAASALYHFDSSVLSIRNNARSAISIYPNPTDGLVYVSSPSSLKAVVTGIDGKKEMEMEDAKVLDMGKFPPGLYMIALYDKNGQIVFRQKLSKL